MVQPKWSKKVKIKNNEIRSHQPAATMKIYFLRFLLLKMHCFLLWDLGIKIPFYRHISLNVTNCSNYSDEVQGWQHYDDVIMSPAHLTGSNRKVPKDISVMDECLLVYCHFVKSNYNLDLNKSYLWLWKYKTQPLKLAQCKMQYPVRRYF